MERAVQGEGQEDIFAADAPGFKSSGIALAVAIAVLVLFGLLYESWRRRQKWKVEDIGGKYHYNGV